MKKRKNFFLFYLPFALLLVFIIFPYAWTFLTSLKNTSELYTKTVHYLPEMPTLNNYRFLFTNTDFIPSMLRSTLIATVTSCIAIIVSSMAGYAFSRYRFPGRDIALSGILLLYMFPQVLFLTPLFITFRNLYLLGSWVSLVIAYCTFTIPFAIWLMTGFMDEIPQEIEEAAKIDGASMPQLFLRVIIPLLKPGMVATGSYIFINSWNEYLYAVMFTSSETRTLPVSLFSFIGEYDVRWDMISAGGITAVIPVVLLFMLVQKHLVTGMTAGSVKG